ncbi:hypothetical protein GIB67_039248 [Kingdonia uniflora]|uniref:GB1/RHD3-type G domain-containing protein n=1 Tax=Kingdonia uniflora TaxID=39325 RepID=A0A7J7MM63_9MAGN|nr:hypothetical protein GIB67_039248 [Kingdonia uniflora]
MMRNFFNRGGSSSDTSPQSSPSPSPLTPPPPLYSPSMPNIFSTETTGPARPLRLVYFDEKGKFRMDPEAVSMLQLVKGPIGVVSVCGRARQGKSFILNQGTYSTQIFSLAVLLSSMFIYNQMGGIDEAALDRLSLVTEMTKHIRVRASGGKSTVSELGQFSPIFVWLLRDFYLDLAEDDRKITPRDYLELALRPMQGTGKDTSPKNEIRESIRALFPDRECFTLVRPLNNENDLRRLDQISLNRLRPEFRSGLDALTKFVFERTRPKQFGATVMTGPILAGVTQSFLDALNNGAVPTISSSWQVFRIPVPSLSCHFDLLQSVEEAECRRAYDSASEVYMSSFDRSKPPDEVTIRESHEEAVQKSLAAFNSRAVGAGSVRQKYEKHLQTFLRKAFEVPYRSPLTSHAFLGVCASQIPGQVVAARNLGLVALGSNSSWVTAGSDYKRNAFLEADLRCSNTIQGMEKKLRAACHLPDAKIDNVLKLLDDLLSEYEASSHGPGKWQKLATFLQQSLEGPIVDFFKKQLDHSGSEKGALMLKCRSIEDKVGLLNKQLEASDKNKTEYLRRYENAINDKKSLSDDYTGRITNLQSKCSSLEERCLTLMKSQDSAKHESAEWRRKYERISSKQKAEEDQANAEIVTLKSRTSAAEAMLAAAREQAHSALEEAAEWKQKFNLAARETKAALEKAATVQERTTKQNQLREDALREEFFAILAEKEDEVKDKTAKIEYTDQRLTTLSMELKAAESKMENYDLETLSLKHKIKELVEKLESAKETSQSFERDAKILEQERSHLEEKYLSDFKRFEESQERFRIAEKEAKRATEWADKARAEAATAQKEKSEVQRVAMERSTQIERTERQIETLERLKSDLMDEVERFRVSEMDALSKVSLLEARVEEREKEIESLLKSNNKERATNVQVLQGLLQTERTARAEANARAESLSMQLQSTQEKLDLLQQEMTSVRLNETALDSKLKTASHGKRLRSENYDVGMESVQDMEVDDRIVRGRKRSKSTASPLKPQHPYAEDGGSVIRVGADEDNTTNSQKTESEDYTKLTILKLKQELTKHGFGAELLQLKNPNKKDFLSLYEKHMLEK